jgi:DNA-binding FadR family transcriptional regulator
MLRATQRVGLRVLPERMWNVFDPHVIGWRLRSPGRREQLRELFELRLAVEPEAARLAAERRDSGQAAALIGVAAQLSSQDAGQHEFLHADLEFHRIVLEASGNSTFVHLGDVIGEALRERATVVRADRPPDTHDLRLHHEVAVSVERRDGASASARMREIIERTRLV